MPPAGKSSIGPTFIAGERPASALQVPACDGSIAL
jgi:hypothetical protein